MSINDITENAIMCKILYEKYGNLTKVVEQLSLIHHINISDNTAKRWLKNLLKNEFNEWYEKYKLMGKYSWEDASKWKEIYESLGSFKKVKDNIDRDFEDRTPHEDIIRWYVRKYIEQILEETYNEWLNKYSFNMGNLKYTFDDVLYWKKLYEKFGSLKEIRVQIHKELNQNPPDAMTIRNGLRDLLGEDYKNWLSKFFKYSLDSNEIEKCKKLFEEEGTYRAVSEITGHDKKSLRKHFKNMLGKDYDNWYEKYSNHHLRKYSHNEILEWKSLFEELGSFPSVNLEIKSTYGINIGPSVIRKIVKRYLKENRIDYQD